MSFLLNWYPMKGMFPWSCWQFKAQFMIQTKRKNIKNINFSSTKKSSEGRRPKKLPLKFHDFVFRISFGFCWSYTWGGEDVISSQVCGDFLVGLVGFCSDFLRKKYEAGFLNHRYLWHLWRWQPLSKHHRQTNCFKRRFAQSQSWYVVLLQLPTILSVFLFQAQRGMGDQSLKN